jgi:phosphoribosylamine--glycine ligase
MLARSLHEEKPTPKLIEFNCRFGDPEAMNVLPLLSEETNFLRVCERIAEGKLKPKNISFEEKATVCKYIVPAGYPQNAAAGQPISVDEKAMVEQNAGFFYASVDLKDGHLVTTASRTIAVLGIADTLIAAEEIAETATRHVQGALRHRRDIGTADLIRKRMEHVKGIGAAPSIVNALDMGIA